jgi:hypothetical protein
MDHEATSATVQCANYPARIKDLNIWQTSVGTTHTNHHQSGKSGKNRQGYMRNNLFPCHVNAIGHGKKFIRQEQSAHYGKMPLKLYDHIPNASQNLPLMPIALLTIITENLPGEIIADWITGKLRPILGNELILESLEPYPKFPGSHKTELRYFFQANTVPDLLYAAISQTALMAGPWLVYFDPEDNSLELIYNKTESSRPTDPEFGQIRWAHWQYQPGISI